MQPRRSTASQLPSPDPQSAAHSARVAAALHERIECGGGSISFGEFMQHALYAPGLGYYAAGAQKFGPGGDFVTAPEISHLFGYVVARQAAAILRITGGDILELGAGSGALAVQVLAKLQSLGQLPGRYLILEVSADLRERQQRLIERECPGMAGLVTWLDGLPVGFRGVLLANEVADALPVERFVRTADRIDQLRVVTDGDAFAWQAQPAPDWLQQQVLHVEDYLDRQLPAGYVSELSPGLKPWVGELASCLEQGMILLFDYGVSRAEYYAEERDGGWLRCHFRHRAHNDPLVLPGIQDLTAWVDFTAIAEAAVDHHVDVAGFVAQSHFLLHGGLADELADAAGMSEQEQFELSRQVKLLTLPGEMGEHFKCMALARDIDHLPQALLAADRSHRL